MKSYIIMLMVVFGSLTARANDNYYLLALKYLDDIGNTETFYVKLMDKPVISLTPNKLEISGSNVVLLYDKVVSISFVDSELTPIDGVVDDKKQVPQIIYFDGETLKLLGVEEKSKISLYTIDGKMVAYVVANASSEAVLSLSHLPNAVYLVKTNKKSFKIIKK